MQISLRSQLIAGTAAVVGASAIAIAMTPGTVAQVPTVKVPSAAQVALTGLDSPISEMLNTASWINYDLFNGNVADIDDNYTWEPYAGMLPEFIFTALPVISQLGYNGADYVYNSLYAVNDSAYILSEAVWNLPGALITATKQVFSGNFSGAVDTLNNAIVVPIQDAVTSVVGATTYVASNVITNLTNVIAALPDIAKGLLNTSVGTVKATFNAVVEITTQTADALFGGDFETAWNTVVDGLFGPIGNDGFVTSSVPGVLESLTIGPGIGPLGVGNGYEVQSFRMWGEQSQLTIANAVGSSWPVASVAVPKSAAARAPRKAASVAAVTASPAAEVASSDNGSAGGDSAAGNPVAEQGAGSRAAAGAAGASDGRSARSQSSTPKRTAKHGVSRKAAKAAASR
ncbi:MAG: hypothetical protein KDB71_16630 [Mycobacterium sp.]|nr:hypothetical protein [Mycobacterium sp.]